MIRRALAALAACMLLAGCGVVTGVTATQRELREAGYHNPNAGYEQSSTSPGPVLTIRWDSSAETADGYTTETRGIASVVWREAPLRFTILRLEPNRRDAVRQRVSFTREELTTMFGPRPAGLREDDVGSSAGRALRWFVTVVVLVIALGGAVTVVVMRWRASRHALEG